ncbi:metallophosphoesterase [Breznakiella homolactica]|uniref:Metallophosphoesterase n=1 Tax=Breznakiella homolactica TaxID=2798577 RepID=A0A7T8BCN3_9SPIR|nr:metallophosphoesterase [Breznakiella homolactica]
MVLAAAVPAISCSNDLFGLVSAGDSSERESYRNVFVFPAEAERNISLGSSYSFVVLTDVHITGTNAWKLEQLGPILEENNDAFMVITGDITQSGERQELERFIEIAGTFPVPCFPVIGNHDVYFGNWEVWKELIGSSIYRIDAGDTTLIVLDSANASFGANQLDWLEGQLAAAGKNTFVFTHTNLFTDGSDCLQQITDIRERARFMALLENRCTAMFSGHVHRRILREAGGVRYVTLEDFRSEGTYCRVRVSPEGVSYEFRTITADNPAS